MKLVDPSLNDYCAKMKAELLIYRVLLFLGFLSLPDHRWLSRMLAGMEGSRSAEITPLYDEFKDCVEVGLVVKKQQH